MRRLLTGCLAMAWLVLVVPIGAHANSGMIAYKPGAIKAAVAKGQTVLIHYKSTW